MHAAALRLVQDLRHGGLQDDGITDLHRRFRGGVLGLDDAMGNDGNVVGRQAARGRQPHRRGRTRELAQRRDAFGSLLGVTAGSGSADRARKSR
jgi:hypothetical protein